MRIRLSTVGIFLLVTCNMSFAQHITVQTAQKIANSHMAKILPQRGIEATKSASIGFQSITLAAAGTNDRGTDTLYYVFRLSNDIGFIIISADKRVYPVIGYSLQSAFSGQQPPAFVEWMRERKKEIAYVIENGLKPDAKITAAWSETGYAMEDTITKGPFLVTAWDQGFPYNGLCPPDTLSKQGKRCVAGCAVSSMSQIMKFWNYPKTGVDKVSYNDTLHGGQFADFGNTVYQWDNMPVKVRSFNEPVATLFYHLAVALKTVFRANDSYTYNNPRFALVNYFKYHPSARTVWLNKNTPDKWTALIKAEIDSFRPVWISGDSIGSHAFVCDGYKGRELLHINWGWSGQFDGYYYLDKLNPHGSFYTNLQSVIKIYPNALPEDVIEFREGDTLVCAGSTLTYSISDVPGASNYIWSLPKYATGKSTTTTIDILFDWEFKSGVIKVKGNNPLGDGKEKSIFVKAKPRPPFPGEMTFRKSYKQGDTLTISIPRAEGYNYIWRYPPGWKEISGGNTNSVIAIGDTLKGGIEVSLSNGECEGPPRVQFIPVGLKEIDIDNDFLIYPNPTINVLNIRNNGINTTYRFRIYDMMGRLVYQSKADNEKSVNTKNYPHGMYLLKIEAHHKVVYEKFIK